MSKTITIIEAAQRALQSIARPAKIDEIYEEILKQQLYEFHTPTPEHVLRTLIRRHTSNVERVDSSDIVLFDMVDDEIYWFEKKKMIKTKKQGSGSMRRIHRATDKEEIIQLLMSEQVGIFKEIWKLLLFAAQIGYKNGRQESLNAIDSGKGIDQSTFGNCPAWPGILYLMSLADTEKTDVLGGSSASEDERIILFQEYANGGLSILREFFANRLTDIEGMLDFIEIQSAEQAKAPDLDFTI